jgi:hypothetical protein
VTGKAAVSRPPHPPPREGAAAGGADVYRIRTTTLSVGHRPSIMVNRAKPGTVRFPRPMTRARRRIRQRSAVDADRERRNPSGDRRTSGSEPIRAEWSRVTPSGTKCVADHPAALPSQASEIAATAPEASRSQQSGRPQGRRWEREAGEHRTKGPRHCPTRPGTGAPSGRPPQDPRVSRPSNPIAQCRDRRSPCLS